ncbi:thioester reductase domain-containing protein [Streptomyces amakusaensis]|uniref:Amino acid adenylation domain-containing protein n=1 Tax=Streptomyces amakusaensis TaxID=67271 RepID=A0ABW0AQ96_9ACTN
MATGPTGSTSPTENTGPAPLVHPMSWEQEGIWLNDQLGDGVSRYVESWVHRLRGPLDARAVEAALTGVVRRHEALRSRLLLADGLPVQEVLPPMPVPLARRRVTAGELDRAVREAVSGPLPLDRPPLLRATLLEVGDDDAVLAVAVHHAAVDGWALYLLDEEFSSLYRAETGEPEPELPPVPLQPGPYARRQRTSGAPRAETVEHWRRTLADPPPESTFPLDRPRPATLGHQGGTVEFTLEEEFVSRLRRLCGQTRATPFTVFAAALTALMDRHGDGHGHGHGDGDGDGRGAILGVPVSRRDGTGTEPMIACLAEVLPLRPRTAPGQSFRELVAETKRTAREVGEHRDMPYTRLVAMAGAPRTRSRTPLFQVVLTVDDGQAPGLSLPGVRAERLRPHDGTAKFDAFFHLTPERGVFRGRLEYAAELFTPAGAGLLTERLRVLLDDAVSRPDTAVAELAVLTPEDRERTAVTWAQGPPLAPGLPLAHEAFARAARRTPEAVAVEHEDVRLTFAELDAASGALAARLVAAGHGGGRVGILLERSPELPVAVLAVLRAGGCCVPVDPAYPAERISLMLRDSAAAALLTTRRTLRDLAVDTAGAEALFLEDTAERPASAALPAVSRDDPAYLIYTSGSTGLPKGVLMPHRALAGVIDRQLRRSSSHAPGPLRTAQFAPLSFDVAFQELFSTWGAGGTLVLVDETARRDPARLLALIDDSRVERLFLPYVALQQLAEYAAGTGTAGARGGGSLREVVSAGEQLFITPAVRRFFTENTAAVLDNQYGPSETHVVTAGALTGPPADWPDRAPVGRPVPGARVRILDDRLAPVPPGAVGELCLGGESLAIGYHGRPDITRRMFVPDPLTPGERLYRSGDLGRFLPGGAIEFLGRRDGQIKVRGHRVELGEIESAAKAVPGVADAVVTADTSLPHSTRLVAHYIPAGPTAPDAERLRAALREKLPAAMVPVMIVPVPGFPLTPSGKVDRAALPAPAAPGASTPEPAPARTGPEHRMTEIWREVLGTGRIGADDDFFAHGGDSLLVVRLLLRVHEEWGVRLSLGSFFAAPTVRRMAALLTGPALPAGPGDPTRTAAPDLRADAELPPAIVPTPAPARVLDRPERTFLTGATGFLGTFLLHELLRSSADGLVHCLVRAPDTATGHKRLRAALDGYGLWKDSYTDRIAAVPGDLAEEGLGMPAGDFDGLARRVDTVFHCGAAVNLTQSYERLRRSNVRGTAEVLRLAALHGSVPLHHISTVGVHTAGGCIRPEDPLPPADTLRNGYAQSKWAAEALLEQARERGLRVSVHRPARICGATDSGLCQTSDYFWLLLKGCVEAGLAPADLEERFDLVPVDYVSRAVVALSRTPGAANRTFHLAAGDRVPLARAIGWLRSLGYAVGDVPLADWRRAVEREPANTAHPLLSLLPADAFDAATRFSGAAVFDATSTREALGGSGIHCPRVDEALFTRYVESHVRVGFLPPPTGTG